MKVITQKQFKEAIALHQKWCNSNGAKGKRADFSDVDFSGWEMRHVNLNLADLREADLYGVDLRGANLREANLREANLYRADLYRADLYGADLYRADLYRADLYGVDLRGANLYGVDLYGVDLRGADLREANLREANLYRADLRGADLRGANLYGANLYGVAGVPSIACPEKGSFIGFKKAIRVTDETTCPCIVELEILEDALRSSATTRKCRCSKAKVVSITTLDGEPLDCEAFSSHDMSFRYRVGETVKVDDFDTDRWRECAPGIHFFITRQEAVDY